MHTLTVPPRTHLDQVDMPDSQAYLRPDSPSKSLGAHRKQSVLMTGPTGSGVSVVDIMPTSGEIPQASFAGVRLPSLSSSAGDAGGAELLPGSTAARPAAPFVGRPVLPNAVSDSKVTSRRPLSPEVLPSSSGPVRAAANAPAPLRHSLPGHIPAPSNRLRSTTCSPESLDYRGTAGGTSMPRRAPNRALLSVELQPLNPTSLPVGNLEIPPKPRREGTHSLDSARASAADFSSNPSFVARLMASKAPAYVKTLSVGSTLTSQVMLSAAPKPTKTYVPVPAEKRIVASKDCFAPPRQLDLSEFAPATEGRSTTHVHYYTVGSVSQLKAAWEYWGWTSVKASIGKATGSLFYASPGQAEVPTTSVAQLLYSASASPQSAPAAILFVADGHPTVVIDKFNVGGLRIKSAQSGSAS